MIKVDLQPEPDDFDSKVKTPGQNFLKTIPRPRGKQWNRKEFWRRAISDMMELYNSVCAYSSLWIKPHQPTVDHYVSRDENPNLAYEWKNLRLAMGRINTRKGKHKDILDPFTIGENWFVLDFTTFGINPNPALGNVEKDAVKNTIKILDLDNRDYREVRETWFNAFRNNITELEKYAPFVAHEMRRQGIN